MDSLNPSDAAAPSQPGQVQVYFTTKSPDLELPESKRQLLVPTSVRRYGLSQILNSDSMLDTPTPIPFDILINGTFLRTTLDEYLISSGLSSETLLTLEYVRSLIPPLYEGSFQHEDWLSTVDILSPSSAVASWSSTPIPSEQQRILTGSYDGLLRVWNKSGQCISTSSLSPNSGVMVGIKSAKFISPTQIVSSGLDRTVKLWKYEESDQFSGSMSCTLELYGHKGSVDSVAVHGPSNRILSASTDGTIGIWSTQKGESPAAPEALISNKRRKLNAAKQIPSRGALSLINAHAAPATAVIFDPKDQTVGYSVSQDHTLKTLDLATSTVVDTRTTSHPLFSLAALPNLSNQLLAAGTSARHIVLIDPRVSAQTTSVMTLRGHTNLVSDLARDPESEYGLVSASHDGTCRVWDLRSTRKGTKDEGNGVVGEAVYIIERESRKAEKKKPVGGEGVKVFGVAWDKDVGIVSVGEDKQCQINRGKGVTKHS